MFDAAVKAKFQSAAAWRDKPTFSALVPRLDDGFLTLLRFGLIDRARQELEAAAALSIFGSRDHGALLAIADLKRRAIQYDIGNPLTASLMTRHKVSTGLYAPIRVLLLESPEGEVSFEYDLFRPELVRGFLQDVLQIIVELPSHNIDSLVAKLSEGRFEGCSYRTEAVA